MSSLLDVKNLCVCVKKDNHFLKIINDISFSINEGEILGIAGESGCGKSMTALSISNLLPKAVQITSGEIIYNNQSLTNLGEKEMRRYRGSEISFIFQDAKQALNPIMKIGNQITENLEMERSKTERGFFRNDKKNNKIKALEILSTLGFPDPQKIFNAFPHQLSGGMCQRVMTAIALVRCPKLLLADEPSSSLDEESQEKCLSLLLKMNQSSKMSLLIISHDLSIIRNFCSRFLIMYAGKIVEEGQSDMLYSPLHPYTHALVNAIPNKEKRGTNLANIPGKVPSVEDIIPGCPFSPRCSKAQEICKETFPPVKEFENRKVNCFFPITGEVND